MSGSECEHDVITVSVSTDTARWVGVIAKTTGESEAEVIEQCCRHGLADYEHALALEK